MNVSAAFSFEGKTRGLPRQTAVCGELASRGHIVAAIEHRNGTGPSVRVTNEWGDERFMLVGLADLE